MFFLRTFRKRDFMKSSCDSILGWFADHPGTHSVGEISAATRIARPLLSRLLSSLYQAGRVHRKRRGHYRLGCRTFRLQQPVKIERGEWVALEGRSLRLKYEVEPERWVSNEELGYAYAARLLLDAGGQQCQREFSWYDRTEDDEGEQRFAWQEFQFLIHGVSKKGIGLTVTAPPVAALAAT